MARHRRSGIGAGIEGWMGADRYERELMLRQKRQEASIGHEKQALGFDERRVRLAEQAGEMEQQLFPSRLQTSQQEAAQSTQKTEAEVRRVDEEAALGTLHEQMFPGIPISGLSYLEMINSISGKIREEKEASALTTERERQQAIPAEVTAGVETAGAVAERGREEVQQIAERREAGVPRVVAERQRAEAVSGAEVAQLGPEAKRAEIARTQATTKRTKKLTPHEIDLMSAQAALAQSKAEAAEKGLDVDYTQLQKMDEYQSKLELKRRLVLGGMLPDQAERFVNEISSPQELYNMISRVNEIKGRVSQSEESWDFFSPEEKKRLFGSADRRPTIAEMEKIAADMIWMLKEAYGITYGEREAVDTLKGEIFEPYRREVAPADRGELRKGLPTPSR